jgi:hypothetical protein
VTTCSDFVSRNTRVPLRRTFTPSGNIRSATFVSVKTAMVPELGKFAILVGEVTEEGKLEKSLAKREEWEDPLSDMLIGINGNVFDAREISGQLVETLLMFRQHEGDRKIIRTICFKPI